MIDYVTFYIITVILSLHFIADFIFQPDWIAKLKSKDNMALAAHVFIYSIITAIGYNLLIFPLILYGYSGSIISEISAIFLIYVTVTHFATDWVTSRINSRLYKRGKIHEFFVGVGIDQWIHYLTLFGFFFMMEMGNKLW